MSALALTYSASANRLGTPIAPQESSPRSFTPRSSVWKEWALTLSPPLSKSGEEKNCVKAKYPPLEGRRTEGEWSGWRFPSGPGSLVFNSLRRHRASVVLSMPSYSKSGLRQKEHRLCRLRTHSSLMLGLSPPPWPLLLGIVDEPAPADASCLTVLTRPLLPSTHGSAEGSRGLHLHRSIMTYSNVWRKVHANSPFISAQPFAFQTLPFKTIELALQLYRNQGELIPVHRKIKNDNLKSRLLCQSEKLPARLCRFSTFLQNSPLSCGGGWNANTPSIIHSCRRTRQRAVTFKQFEGALRPFWFLSWARSRQIF